MQSALDSTAWLAVATFAVAVATAFQAYALLQTGTPSAAAERLQKNAGRFATS